MRSSKTIRKLGEVSHLTPNHRAVIVDAPFIPEYEAHVLNERAETIGKIANIFGPHTKPYVSFLILEDQSVTPGEPVFVSSKQRKRRSRQKKRKTQRPATD